MPTAPPAQTPPHAAAIVRHDLDLAPLVADELGLPLAGVRGVLELFAEGGTVPFIARYRKEKTGSLDEVQIRDIQERHLYRKELEERRHTVLDSIREQGKLDPQLQRRILQAKSKAALEDLYLPFKPKRRTRGSKASEAGLEPLADLMDRQGSEEPRQAARIFVDPKNGVADVDAALQGARDIIAERLANNADIRAQVREHMQKTGKVRAEAAKNRKASTEPVDMPRKRTKFDEYLDFTEAASSIPSHRLLAVRRGQKEGVLRCAIDVDLQDGPLTARLEKLADLQRASPWGQEVQTALQDSLTRLVVPQVETDIWVELKMRADKEAVQVFAQNLRHILLAAPFGPQTVIGIDPGLRTGCKTATVDATGTFGEYTTLFLSGSAEKKAHAETALSALLDKHRPRAIAVGNGTGGRETETWVRDLLRKLADNWPQAKDVLVLLVNEAGASIYSASDVARDEFPDLDLTIRGAISIARRLQDPLAELVKVDPKSIGVGQYQHDVAQSLLGRKLEEVVEDCVNQVGVELNTASAPLLARVAGIGPSLAKKLVAHREKHGRFASREQVHKVPGFGPRSYQQAAGFLRVQNSDHPLDNSAVHPERYPLIERMAADIGVGTDLGGLIGDTQKLARISERLNDYIDESAGLGKPTLTDIVAELKKPGRDPRQDFSAPSFRDDVHSLSDLTAGMRLEGVVTNVTNFGAFVDIGVHQDGLVHVSQLADQFVKDPHKVVHSGQRVKVKVLEIDLERKRISLSCRSDAEATTQAAAQQSGKRHTDDNPGKKGPQSPGKKSAGGARQKKPARQFKNNPFAALLK